MTTSNHDSERGAGGRFAPGNPGGPGRPRLAHLQALRDAVYNSVEPGDVQRVMNALRDAALAGDVQACVQYLRRVLGPETTIDLIERLELLEAQQRSQSP